jgi:hypothetical protein
MGTLLTMVERAKQIRAVAAAVPMIRDQAAQTADDSALLDMADLFPDWTAGDSYRAGTIIRHNNALYRVQQDVKSQAKQSPDAKGMLAVYAPVQQPSTDGRILDWMSGETGLKVGDKRRDLKDGNVYTVLQDVGANVWEPHSAPTLWKPV